MAYGSMAQSVSSLNATVAGKERYALMEREQQRRQIQVRYRKALDGILFDDEMDAPARRQAAHAIGKEYDLSVDAASSQQRSWLFPDEPTDIQKANAYGGVNTPAGRNLLARMGFNNGMGPVSPDYFKPDREASEKFFAGADGRQYRYDPKTGGAVAVAGMPEKAPEKSTRDELIADGFSPEQADKALRIDAGLEPRAGASAGNKRQDYIASGLTDEEADKAVRIAAGILPRAGDEDTFKDDLAYWATQRNKAIDQIGTVIDPKLHERASMEIDRLLKGDKKKSAISKTTDKDPLGLGL